MPSKIYGNNFILFKKCYYYHLEFFVEISKHTNYAVIKIYVAGLHLLC